MSCSKSYSDGPCDWHMANNVSQCTHYPLDFPCMEFLTARPEDVREYGFLGLNSTGGINDIETTWNKTSLRPITLRPALNISAFYIHDAAIYNSYSRNGSSTPNRPPSNSSNLAFTTVDSNATYSSQYMKDNGRCQPIEVYDSN
jgi:hypothetical protein